MRTHLSSISLVTFLIAATAMSMLALTLSAQTTPATGPATGASGGTGMGNDYGSSTGSRNVSGADNRSTADANAPVSGANSFTEAQVRSRMTDAGYRNITQLKSTKNGIWTARAQYDGQPHKVYFDYQGNITSTPITGGMSGNRTGSSNGATPTINWQNPSRP